MRDRTLAGRLYDKCALPGLAIFACTGPFQRLSELSKMMQTSSSALHDGWEEAQQLYLGFSSAVLADDMSSSLLGLS